MYCKNAGFDVNLIAVLIVRDLDLNIECPAGLAGDTIQLLCQMQTEVTLSSTGIAVSEK